MSFSGTRSLLLRLYDRMLAGCRHPVLSTLLLLGTSLLIIAIDALAVMELDLTALLILPLIAVTLCRGPKLGLGAAWGMAVLKESADRLRWGDSVPWYITSGNIIIWGTVATLLVLLVTTAKEAQRLHEAEVQLRTLRQTMVTVQDIVRNRLLLVTITSDLLEAGIMPQPRHIKLLRSAVIETLALLNQLSRVETFTVDEVAEGIHAVRFGSPAAGGAAGAQSGAGADPGTNPPSNEPPAR
jgi:hypothetical protein